MDYYQYPNKQSEQTPNLNDKNSGTTNVPNTKVKFINNFPEYEDKREQETTDRTQLYKQIEYIRSQ